MIGCLQTRVHKQPIVTLYFEFETVLKFYSPKAWTGHSAYAFICGSVVRDYDIVTILWRSKIDAYAILYGEIHCMENDILIFNSVLSVILVEKNKIWKNNDHTCLFQCINNCQVPWEMFEHLVWLPCVQTASLGPDKCKCCGPYILA